jgi:hypothetical protein
MNRPRLAIPLGIACLALAARGAVADDPGIELVGLMGNMQTYTHKLQLSVAARNAALSGFYLHELEETAETIAGGVDSYDGFPVGRMTKDLLLPAVERLEEPVKKGDWGQAEEHFEGLMGTCNACHEATEHGYIRIAPASGNPFAQDFSPPGG